MYKELATILTPDKSLGGFVVYDDESGDTMVMNPEEMARKAELGLVDTLRYDKDTKSFIPDFGQFHIEGRGRRFLKHIKNQMQNMTFKEFVDNDCNFRMQDIKLMETHDDLILAAACAGFVTNMPDMACCQLTMSFYSSWDDAIDRLCEYFGRYGAKRLPGVKSMKRYGNFVMINLPFIDSRTGFSLETLGELAGVHILFNPDKTESIVKNTQTMVKHMPFFTRCLMARLAIDEQKAASLMYFLQAANRAACQDMCISVDE